MVLTTSARPLLTLQSISNSSFVLAFVVNPICTPVWAACKESANFFNSSFMRLSCLDETNHLCRGGGSYASEEEASEVDDDFEGDFQPIGQGNFILTHNSVF